MGYFWRFIAGAGNNKRLNYLIISLFFLSPVLLNSCNQKPADSGDYSSEFKTIFAHTSLLFENQKTTLAGLHYLDSAFNALNNPTINDKFRHYGFHYVYSQKVTLNYKEALLYADSMLMMARQSVTKEQYQYNFAEANYAKGDTYFSLQQFNEAYQCYFQGYLLGKNYLHLGSLADYTYRMGMIMYKQGHYKLAADYFKESYSQSLAIKDDFPEFYRKQELLDNIGISYKHNGNIDSSLVYFDKGLKYINDNAAKYPSRSRMIENAKGVIYGNKAESFVIKGQNAPARELLKKSIAINLKKGGDNADAVLAEIKLGKLFLIVHKNDSLISLLNNVHKQLDTVKNEYAEADWNKLMSSYYEQRGDFSKALGYFQRYHLLRDSTVKRLSSLKNSDANQQIAIYEKQHEIEDLNSNNQLQRVYLKVAIVCAVMLLAIIFLVLWNWRRSKLDIATVILLNKQISEQKVDLEKALDEIKHSSQEKDRILRAVAHDLRNPLGGIASLTSIMVEESEHDKDLASQLKLIKDTSNDTLELINEILEATNTSSKTLSKQWVEVNALLNNSVELLRFKAAEKHQQILIEGLDNTLELHVNREKIWRVISNLISNAIKFSPVGEAIKVKAVQKRDHVVISITDHGIGIPDNMKDRVFNMFTDAKRHGTIGEKSFGLGLSISKQIIEKHNGKIWFESELKKGTVFYISLPRSNKPLQSPDDSKAAIGNELISK
jgi:two-component system, OmpR family, sensor histidine kinase VicK